jgi:hypothetical protein
LGETDEEALRPAILAEMHMQDACVAVMIRPPLSRAPFLAAVTGEVPRIAQAVAQVVEAAGKRAARSPLAAFAADGAGHGALVAHEDRRRQDQCHAQAGFPDEFLVLVHRPEEWPRACCKMRRRVPCQAIADQAGGHAVGHADPVGAEGAVPDKWRVGIEGKQLHHVPVVLRSGEKLQLLAQRVVGGEVVLEDEAARVRALRDPFPRRDMAEVAADLGRHERLFAITGVARCVVDPRDLASGRSQPLTASIRSHGRFAASS